MGGIAALRLGAIYGSSEIGGRRIGVDLQGAEGTWTFLAAGGAALIVTWFGLAAGGVRRPRASSMQPVSSVPPPEEHVITGDDPSAIVAAGDASGRDDDTSETERTRVEPMPAMPSSTATTPIETGPVESGDDTTQATTWNAADEEPDRPRE
jgi:hypothetical protein